MFAHSTQNSAAEPSFLYLLMAATYFRQGRRSYNPHMRRAVRNIGREYLANADHVVLTEACSRLARTAGQTKSVDA